MISWIRDSKYFVTKGLQLPDSLDLLVLLAQALLHLGTEGLEGGVSVGQLVLGVLENTNTPL